jgi:hypothetical protein
MIQENRNDPSVRFTRRLDRGFCESRPGVPLQEPERANRRSAEREIKEVAALGR